MTELSEEELCKICIEQAKSMRNYNRCSGLKISVFYRKIKEVDKVITQKVKNKEDLEEAEKWINELGYRHILIDSRVEAVSFYEKLGYSHSDNNIVKSGNFDCIRMERSFF